MPLPRDDREPGEGQVTGLDPLYEEVCKAHDSITDFRGKLLALVPALSAAAFTLIATRKSFDHRLLLVAGIFGAAVTLGLFCYELRGMLLCRELRDRGDTLERAMRQPASIAIEDMQGHFLDRTESHKVAEALHLLKCYWPISVPTASFVVYLTVIASWLGMAVVGIVAFFSAAGT